MEQTRMTDLKNIARQIKLKGYSKMRKAELYEALHGSNKGYEAYQISDSDLKELALELGLSPVKSRQGMIKKVTKELSNRMCKCIKKVNLETNDEHRSIAICRKTVLQHRGVDFYHVDCKKGMPSPKKSPKGVRSPKLVIKKY